MTAFAAAMKVTRPFLYDVENSRRGVSASRARQLSRVLDLDEAALIRASALIRNKVELRTQGTSPTKRQLGAMLMSQWEQLTDDKARAMLSVFGA